MTGPTFQPAFCFVTYRVRTLIRRRADIISSKCGQTMPPRVLGLNALRALESSEKRRDALYSGCLQPENILRQHSEFSAVFACIVSPNEIYSIRYKILYDV